MINPNNAFQPTQAPTISLNDIYFTLFRNKVKIILCAILGIVVGVGLYLNSKPTYLSEARLFIRYVEKVTTAASFSEGAENRGADVQLLSTRADGIIASELQILTSHDLIAEVVKKIGAEKFVEDPEALEDPALLPYIANKQIIKNLSVSVPRGSTIINVLLANNNSALVQPILNELIQQYLKRHLETHRSAGGALENFLTQHRQISGPAQSEQRRTATRNAKSGNRFDRRK